ncbi:MAG: hypothetical protein GY786_10250 [Proteobacteria bacterium]|nr:hypothetical protein [Pseudomonadota bacterium]
MIRYYGWFLLQVFVIQGEGIYCVQTQGALYNFHPHIHALVPAGILKDGVFSVKTYPSAQIITQLFRARLLKVLIKENVIQEELEEMLMSWNHNVGFIAGSTRLHIGERRKKSGIYYSYEQYVSLDDSYRVLSEFFVAADDGQVLGNRGC